MSRSEPHPDPTRRQPARQLPPQQLTGILQRARRRSWLELAWQFPRERECLAGFLALESAEVLSGCKPANLIRLANRPQPCGRNLFALWERFGRELLAASALEVCCCRRSAGEILLLIYRRDLLERRLQSRTAASFLRRCGYPSSAPEQALAELQRRFATQAIPHEIGLFLGYPLKDVTAFLGWSDRPYSCQRGWKIYGRTQRSLALAERHNASRSRMSERLGRGQRPELLLRGHGEVTA